MTGAAAGPEGASSALDAELLEILVCPACHGALALEPDVDAPHALRCTATDCGLVYPVRDGIPILLVDEASRDDG
jgi:uncharacterized protein YbaR (Trm112 family)